MIFFLHSAPELGRACKSALVMLELADEEPEDDGGGLVGVWPGCQLRAQDVGGQGQKLLPYFFMRATLTEGRQNGWPVKTNEKE